MADFLGRRRMFMVGLIGFASASALGGAALNAPMLFGARALQGAFAAVMAPAALSLISVTFTDTKERARAFGVYGVISGGGAAIGLILGGVLTQYASWRWCLLSERSDWPGHCHLRRRCRHREPCQRPLRLRHSGHDRGDQRSGVARVRLHQGQRRRMEFISNHPSSRAGHGAAHHLRRHRAWVK